MVGAAIGRDNAQRREPRLWHGSICVFAIFAFSHIARKSSIARFVRQTRTMIYDKTPAAKSFFSAFPAQTRASFWFAAIFVRQTRTRSVRYSGARVRAV